MNRHVEILAPAGSYESLRAAVCAGADAVYIGGMQFGARAYAKNLTQEELEEAIDYVHIHGRKFYLTVNTLLKDKEIDRLYEYLKPYYERGLDGVIVQDVGAASYIREHFPGLALHASTQMTITGRRGASFMKSRGITRVVPARELSLEEIRIMKEETGLEVECFVHGALCYCYSGQCLLSSMIGGRSGNRGQCAQPCRLPYSVEGGRPCDLMSLKDLCTIDLLPELMEAGIDSFKIEGRMKQPDYVYTVTRLYRKYADLYCQKGRAGYQVSREDREKLLGAYQRRGYSEGYYRQHNGKEMISFRRPPGREEETAAYPDYKIQEKINGKLILSLGQSARLLLEYGTYRIECEGPKPEPAMRQPLQASRVEQQMRKTGNTQFAFERMEVCMEGDLFLPMQALNELRRDGLAALTDRVLSDYRRKAERTQEAKEEAASSREKRMACGDARPGKASKDPQLALLVRSLSQLKAAVECKEAECIYIDLPPQEIKEAARMIQSVQSGKKHYLAMPYIFREDAALRLEKAYGMIRLSFDGILVRNWESLQWLLEHAYNKEIRGDYNLYACNRFSKRFMQEGGIKRFTAPVELNARELKELDIRGQSLIAYGYQPVMVTAGCIGKTMDRCDAKEGWLHIRDRYKKKFAVKKCCAYCYNIIYNSSPLYLADKAQELLSLEPAEIRLDFSTEGTEQMRRIILDYVRGIIWREEVQAPDMEYTRGHFKRGVK